jgi:hypothetical protein
MPDLTAKRTLVKSPPELWEELSEVERLARHLGAFGEIRITRLEPERTVAWEGEHASGTVSIEASGWGTKVVLTADVDEDECRPGAAAEPADAAASAEGAGDRGERASPPEPHTAERDSAVGDTRSELKEPRSELARSRTEPPDEFVAPPRSRWRAFWARFVSGWLVPEERVNRAGAGSRPASEENRAAPEEIPAPGPGTASVEGDASGVAPTGPEPEDRTPVEPEVSASGAAPPTTPAIDRERAEAVLQDALDALGSAHHRPFSRG